MVLVRAAVENGQLIYSTHASIRMGERNIIKPEIEYVLETGYHEAKKTNLMWSLALGTMP